jgi:hypothetical protein
MPTTSDSDDAFGCLLSAVGVLVVIILVVNAGRTNYYLDRDLDSVMDRAQVSADASDMLGYMQTLRANLLRYDATSGHTAYVFQNPRNDLALQYQTVQRIIERLEQIQALPRDSIAYQSALDDIRGIIREMPRPADGVWWCSGGGLWKCDEVNRSTESAPPPASLPTGFTDRGPTQQAPTECYEYVRDAKGGQLVPAPCTNRPPDFRYENGQLVPVDPSSVERDRVPTQQPDSDMIKK